MFHAPDHSTIGQRGLIRATTGRKVREAFAIAHRRTIAAAFWGAVAALAVVPMSAKAGPGDGAMTGRWVPPNGGCVIIFSYDDGRHVQASCIGGGYSHLIDGHYIAPGVVDYDTTRIDPQGCRTSTTGRIHQVGPLDLETRQEGWNGCGVKTDAVSGKLHKVGAVVATATPAPYPPPLPASAPSPAQVAAAAPAASPATAVEDPVEAAIVLAQNGHCEEAVARLQALSGTDPGSARGRIAGSLMTMFGCRPGGGVPSVATAASASATIMTMAPPGGPTPAQAVAHNGGIRPGATIEFYGPSTQATNLSQKIGEGDCTKVKDLQRLAESGDGDGQAWLGVVHMQGICGPADVALGLRWLRRAAQSKSATGQHDLGAAYFEGLGVPVDKVEAARWFRLAADQHYPPAEGNLGNAYINGIGVDKDPAQGVRWLRASVEHDGPPNSADSLGIVYLQGQGVPRNDAEARKWFTAAAARGFDAAQFHVALMDCRGNGAPPNQARCLMWLQVAARGGNASLVRQRDQLRAQLTPAQRDQADELVRQYDQQTPVQRLQTEMDTAEAAAAAAARKPAVLSWSQIGALMNRKSPSGFTMGEVLCTMGNVTNFSEDDIAEQRHEHGLTREEAIGALSERNLDRASDCLAR